MSSRHRHFTASGFARSIEPATILRKNIHRFQPSWVKPTLTMTPSCDADPILRRTTLRESRKCAPQFESATHAFTPVNNATILNPVGRDRHRRHDEDFADRCCRHCSSFVPTITTAAGNNHRQIPLLNKRLQPYVLIRFEWITSGMVIVFATKHHQRTMIWSVPVILPLRWPPLFSREPLRHQVPTVSACWRGRTMTDRNDIIEGSAAMTVLSDGRRDAAVGAYRHAAAISGAG